MEIKDILDSLGLDLSNDEIKRGAIEAIDAILASRQPAPNMGGLGGMSGDLEVELDPDLIQPSKKQPSTTSSNDDIEIEDKEHILDQIKQNEPDEPIEGDTSTNENDDEKQDTSEINSDDPLEKPNSSNASKETEEPTENTSSDNNNEQTDAIENDEEDSNNVENNESDEASDDTAEYEDDSSEEATSQDDNEVAIEPDEIDDTDEEATFDEEDILDSELKDTYNDETIKSKQAARSIKRERTLQAAKATLETAKAKKAAPALIRELENAIKALEALTEAVTKNLKDISDEEFNLLVNRVFDAIEAIGNSGLTFTSDEERELQAKEIKDDISSAKTQQELSAEDVTRIRAENQVIRAREKETGKYKTRAASSFKGFQDFLNSLYRAIALQVQVNEVNDDTWSAINRRHSGTGVLQPGKRINELPDRKIPIIDFYFDQSGSWTAADVAVGEKAVRQLAKMEEDGKIKMNIFYFANRVHTNAASARAEGGTAAWNDIVKNVISTNATNVIIMTDDDMENWWRGESALSYTVPGYVWYLWRDGSNAPRLPRDLKGRGGTQQFSFSTADV